MGGRIDAAVDRLKRAAELSEEVYGQPLNVRYSGGKDSQVVLHLALRSGIRFKATHNLTTVDAPETVRTIRKTFAILDGMGVETELRHPEMTMWQLIPKKLMPPTRLVRYCCKYLKENNAEDTFIATGVRKAESGKRKERGVVDKLADGKGDREAFGDEVFLGNDNAENRRQLERCMAKNAMCVNPIIDWSDAEVFDYYLNECKVHNPLYTEGFKRVGCVGCPMAGTRQRQEEFARWPNYKSAYMRAFEKMLEARRAAGKETTWETADEVFHWWIEDGWNKDQLVLWEEEIWS